jgi:S-sulfo-L-cysteine synthase (O-acetyl-L-serine-dependent)
VKSAASIAELVGNTPLVRIRNVTAGLKKVQVFAKLEFFNPGGSVKDRAALGMMQTAIASGALTPEKILIDSTSGNTGVAYSWMGAALGYRVALVMPPNVSIARKQITRAYGAELIYSDPMEGSDGAIRRVRELVAENPEKYFYPDQYSNAANPGAHEKGTAKEIWEQTSGKVTHLVCGIGTGGTVMGTGRGLKAKNPRIHVAAVEPLEPMHGLEGLKHMPSSLVPAIYVESELDEKISIATDDGWDMAERLVREEGLLVGHSGGAAMLGALKVAQRVEAAGGEGLVVTVFPDRADRYFEPVRWEKEFEW